MSAGTGIRHAEHDREAATTRLFQIWILPAPRGARPPGARVEALEDAEVLLVYAV